LFPNSRLFLIRIACGTGSIHQSFSPKLEGELRLRETSEQVISVDFNGFE
jgi:hypothetical protein